MYSTLAKPPQERTTMTALVLISVSCLILPTQADTCSQGQHCSSCDQTSGNCTTECYIGYFDRKCKSECSKTCKQKKCKESFGLGNCTEGCELGYYGVNCRLKCFASAQHCSECSGGCDGLYCKQKDTCFSGCQDDYHGSGCKNCTGRCKSCNRITGTCVKCHAPYWGENCQFSCVNCSKACDGECARTCAPGLYGTECADVCSDNCRPNPAIHSEEQCEEQDRDITIACSPECHSVSGECLYGCVAGWHGPMCTFPCNSACISKRCDDTGTCTEGCTDGHFGTDCKPCPEICTNYTCNPNNETCSLECNNEMYGQFCNFTSKCINGCFITKDGCIANCSHDAPTTECTTGSCNIDNMVASRVNLYAVSLIAVLLIAILLVAVAVSYICYRKGLSTSRTNQKTEEEHNDETTQEERGEYEALHRYWKIRESDMDRESETETPNNQGIGEEMAAAFPILADRFFQVTGPGVAGGVENLPNSSSGANKTYTIAGAPYISPIGDDQCMYCS